MTESEKIRSNKVLSIDSAIFSPFLTSIREISAMVKLRLEEVDLDDDNNKDEDDKWADLDGVERFKP